MTPIDFRKLIINQNYCTQIPYQELNKYNRVKHSGKSYKCLLLMDYYNNFLQTIESKSVKPLSNIQFIVKSITELDLIHPNNKIFPIIYKKQII
jgi:hypothetical protein